MTKYKQTTKSNTKLRNDRMKHNVLLVKFPSALLQNMACKMSEDLHGANSFQVRLVVIQFPYAL